MMFALIIPIINFFFRLYPRFFNKHFGVDDWTRLTEIDHVRKAGHRIPGKLTKGFIIEGYFDYPPLFPWLLSFFSREQLDMFKGYIPGFFDSLLCLFVFFVAYQLTGNIPISIISQLIYLATPLVALENVQLTPRSFGYLNFTMAMYFLLLYSVAPSLPVLLLGYVLSTCLFLSHRFAMQSFLLATIFFSFVDKTFFYAGIYVLGFFTAVVVTRGYYLRVLYGHWSNIYFWIVNYNYRFAHQLKGIVKESKKVDFIARMNHIFRTLSPIALLATNVWIISGFVFIYLYATHQHILFMNNPLVYKMALWLVFFYIFGVIVLSFKILIPIGEGQRYPEMAVLPSSVLTALLLFSFLHTPYKGLIVAAFIIMLVGNCLLILFVQIKGIIKDKNRSMTTAMEDAFAFINKLPGTPRIICIPHQIATMTMYNTKADVLVNADNPGLLKISDFFPILAKPIPEIAKKYNLDYLILRETFAKIEDLKLKKTNIAFRSGDIVIIKL